MGGSFKSIKRYCKGLLREDAAVLRPIKMMIPKKKSKFPSHMVPREMSHTADSDDDDDDVSSKGEWILKLPEPGKTRQEIPPQQQDPLPYDDENVPSRGEWILRLPEQGTSRQEIPQPQQDPRPYDEEDDDDEEEFVLEDDDHSTYYCEDRNVEIVFHDSDITYGNDGECCDGISVGPKVNYEEEVVTKVEENDDAQDFLIHTKITVVTADAAAAAAVAEKTKEAEVDVESPKITVTTAAAAAAAVAATTEEAEDHVESAKISSVITADAAAVVAEKTEEAEEHVESPKITVISVVAEETEETEEYVESNDVDDLLQEEDHILQDRDSILEEKDEFPEDEILDEDDEILEEHDEILEADDDELLEDDSTMDSTNTLSSSSSTTDSTSSSSSSLDSVLLEDVKLYGSPTTTSTTYVETYQEDEYSFPFCQLAIPELLNFQPYQSYQLLLPMIAEQLSSVTLPSFPSSPLSKEEEDDDEGGTYPVTPPPTILTKRSTESEFNPEDPFKDTTTTAGPTPHGQLSPTSVIHITNLHSLLEKTSSDEGKQQRPKVQYIRPSKKNIQEEESAEVVDEIKNNDVGGAISFSGWLRH